MSEVRYKEKKFGFDMILVEGGHFDMGNEEYEGEKPAHSCSVLSFFMGQFPVTQTLWEVVIGANTSFFKGKNLPVENVSWYDAIVFCNVLNERCGYAPCYFRDSEFTSLYGKTSSGFELPNDGNVYRKVDVIGYRLPTETEWEYAAKGGKDQHDRALYKFSGAEKLDEVGWFRGNSYEETHPVGLKLANELGLFDMSGNVWEWCEDKWNDNYEGAPVDGSAWGDWVGRVYHVLRGGGWNYDAVSCRSASRLYFRPDFRNNYIGFRLVLSCLPVK